MSTAESVAIQRRRSTAREPLRHRRRNRHETAKTRSQPHHGECGVEGGQRIHLGEEYVAHSHDPTRAEAIDHPAL